MPPIESMPQVVMGPAKRQTRVEHGKRVVINKTENGVFWTCAGCGANCEAWGQKIHNHLGVGRQLPAQCPNCKVWQLGSKSQVEVVTDGQANALMRQILSSRRN
jgi:hypothetical protein